MVLLKCLISREGIILIIFSPSFTPYPLHSFFPFLSSPPLPFPSLPPLYREPVLLFSNTVSQHVPQFMNIKSAKANSDGSLIGFIVTKVNNTGPLH